MLCRVTQVCLLWVLFLGAAARGGPFAPAAGQAGSTAIDRTDPRFVAWAAGATSLMRGPQSISVVGSPLATVGSAAAALGPADVSGVVSLGDGGHVALSFDKPIFDGPGFDFAVFENSFSDAFLELAFVEVSSNGTDFFRFPAVSLTPADVQVGSFGALDPTNLDQLAGKYRGGFGTPFDLDVLRGVSPVLEVDRVTSVRIVDVVGTIAPAFATHDSLGNIVNDPWPTAFGSGGFDLDAVGVIHQVPEPATIGLLLLGLCVAGIRRRALAAR